MSLLNKPKIAVVLLVLCCCGCDSGPEIATVEGTVTMDGKPLSGASVLFINTTGRPAGATTDANGHYVLTFTKGRQGAMPGPNKIRISTIRDAGVDETGKPIPAMKETVPMRYNAKTELEFDVKAGEQNVADFKLESKGKVAAASAY